jgi:Common central domain of tyrosinase/Polyphenol oxidase middle domain
MNRRQLLAGAVASAFGGIALGDYCPELDCEGLWTTTRPAGCDPFNPACNPPMGFPNPITIADFGCGSEPPKWIDCVPNEDHAPARRLWSEIDPKKDKAYLEDLRRAYCRLRALPASDHRSLIRQAWLHEFYCSQWPTGNIHNSWAFLPWHRGFLYFHEKILGALICKKDLRLPVWDWDDPRSRWVPGFYRELGLPTFLNGNWGRNISDQTHGKWLNDCVLQAWLFGDTFESFQGSQPCRLDPCGADACPPAKVVGWAANAAHILGHSIVGGAMGNVPTAAADPTFYSHHANVDRYWQWWQQHNGSAIPTPQGFLDQYFFYYDEHEQLVRVHAKDLVNEAALGYSYRPPLTPWCKLEKVDLLENTLRKLTALAVGALLSTPGGIRNVFELTERIASGSLEVNLSRLLEGSCMKSIPAQVRGVITSGTPVPGQYYLVQLVGDSVGVFRLGGFGIFASPHNHAAEPGVAIASCVDGSLWDALHHWKGDKYLSYGPPDATVTGTTGQTGRMNLTGFDLLVPEGLLSTGTAWLKEHALL